MSALGLANTIHGDLAVAGDIVGVQHIAYPPGDIENIDISASAAIEARKCQKSLRLTAFQAGTATSGVKIIMFVKGATLAFKHFTVTNEVANSGGSIVTVNVKKNGVSILSAVVTLDSTKVAYSENLGTIVTLTAVDGDYVTIEFTVTQSGTDAVAQGVMGQLDYDEDYAV